MLNDDYDQYYDGLCNSNAHLHISTQKSEIYQKNTVWLNPTMFILCDDDVVFILDRNTFGMKYCYTATLDCVLIRISDKS